MPPATPCARTARGALDRPTPAEPLLASGGAIQGPGGGSAFIGTDGGLRLAHHAYTLGEQRSTGLAHPRRLRTVRLSEVAPGRLRVG